MNKDLPRLIPGIIDIFESAGFDASVTEVDFQLSITVNVEGKPAETRLFPYPTVNRDLSIPLLAWRAQLISENS
jgi:hypothetical protein